MTHLVRAIAGLLLLLATACSTVPRYDASGDVHAFLLAVRDGDRATFERHVDRRALAIQLRSRLLASAARADRTPTGQFSLGWRTAAAFLAGPAAEVAVDTLVQPEVFRAAALTLGYGPDQAIPNRVLISAILRPLDADRVCVTERSAGACTFVFTRYGREWRLTGYEGELGDLGRLGG